MYVPASEITCLCNTRQRSEAVPGQAPRRPTRSGKCLDCGISRRREAREFRSLPTDIKLLSEAVRPLGSIRGYQDDNFTCRLTVIQVVSKVTTGLTHDEEIKLAGRVYTQLKLESSPLIEPGWEFSAYVFPDIFFGQLHDILKGHLGDSYKYHVSSEMENFI
ncbi:hypothetical protein K449DRAFT_462024 [Hypoxylon sp. EC38]|nr:hypothetical protein K449DRAFT_462024 [Hypoxylon sp. EC38]